MVLGIAWGIALALVLVSALRWYHYTNEDAWITLRYARNLADGFGLVSHPGGLHEEGYSDLLWVLLLAAARRCFGADLLHTAKVLGIASCIGTALISRAVFRRVLGYLGVSGPAFVLSSVLLFVAVGASSFAAFWATQGLETSLYSLEVMLLVWLYLRFVDAGGARRWLLALVVVSWLSWLTRPEGAMNLVVVFAAIAAWLLVTRPGRRRGLDVASAFCFGLALTGLVLVWKRHYFGDIIANPSYIKLGLRRYTEFGPYARDYLTAKGLIYGVVLALAILAIPLLARRMDRKVALVLMLLVGLTASQVCFVGYVGSDYMPHARFFVTHQAATMLIILIVAAYAPWRTFVCLGLALLLTYSALREPIPYAWWWNAGFPAAAHLLDDDTYGKAVRQLTPLMRGGGRYALSEYGYIPFHVDGEGIDIMGLNSRQLARNFKYYPFEEVFYANRDQVLSQLPKVIITTGVFRLGPPLPVPAWELSAHCVSADCRTEDLVVEAGTAWFFKPYLESPFFRAHYRIDVPTDPTDDSWTFFAARQPLTLSHDLGPASVDHRDQLLHGFSGSDTIWASPISRALLQPRATDREVCLATPGGVRVELRYNGEAVGDRIVAASATPEVCAPLPSPADPLLVTLRSPSAFQLLRLYTR